MKMFKLLVLAVLALGVAGCGNKPKLPEGTVVAAYVDLGKALSSGKDIAKMVIKNLPKESQGEKIREPAEKAFEEGLKGMEDALKSSKLSLSSFKWATVAASTDPKDLKFSRYLIVCVDGIESMPSELVLEELDDKIAGEAACESCIPEFRYAVVYDKKYILAGDSKDSLSTLIRTYKGDKPCTDGFGDLAKLKGNTIARCEIDGIAKLLANEAVSFKCEDGTRRTPAEALRYYLKGIDEDMADYLAEFEGLKLDLNAADDELGLSLTVVCGSKGGAKLVEKTFGSVQVLGRVAADAFAVGFRDSMFKQIAKALRRIGADSRRDWIKDMRDSKVVSAVVKHIGAVGQGIEVDRSGSEATICFSIPLDDIVEDVFDNFNEIEEMMEKSRQSSREAVRRILEPAAAEDEQRSAKPKTSLSSLFGVRSESQRSACVANLRQLQVAGESWLTKQAKTDACPTLEDLCGPEMTKYLRKVPKCPCGGTYRISNEHGSIDVTCTVKGHSLRGDVEAALEAISDEEGAKAKQRVDELDENTIRRLGE